MFVSFCNTGTIPSNCYIVVTHLYCENPFNNGSATDEIKILQENIRNYDIEEFVVL